MAFTASLSKSKTLRQTQVESFRDQLIVIAILAIAIALRALVTGNAPHTADSVEKPTPVQVDLAR